MGDTDIKVVTSSSHHSVPPWGLLSRHGPAWAQHHSTAGPIWGQWHTKQRRSGAELCRGALQHPTSPTLWGTPQLLQELCHQLAGGSHPQTQGEWSLLRDLISLKAGRERGQYRVFILKHHSPHACSMGGVSMGSCCLPTCVHQPKGLFPRQGEVDVTREEWIFLLRSCRDRVVALFLTVSREKKAVLVVRGPQLGLRCRGSAWGSSAPVAGQPGHGEGDSGPPTPLYHHRRHHSSQPCSN